jgi:hypothetical protein
MDLKKTFGTDKEKEKKGIIKQIGEGAWVRIARIGNPDYERVLTALSKPYRLQIQRGTLDPKIQDKLYIEVIAKTALLDWGGITDNGVEVTYSVENAIKMLTDYPDFLEFIVAEANRLENFKLQADEDLAGNSEAS